MRKQATFPAPAPPPARRAAAAGLYRQPLTPPVERDEDGYPFSDASGMNSAQSQICAYGFDALRLRCGEGDLVAFDMLVGYAAGVPEAVVGPDLMVVPGVGRRRRSSYRLWEEGVPPSFVLEVLSPSTWRADMGPKRATYEALGVSEFWLLDPEAAYARPPLQGLALREGRYRRIRPDAAGRLLSGALGLELRRTGEGLLRFRDPATGEDLRDMAEAEAVRMAAESARAAETERRAQAEQALASSEASRAALEARLAELEAQLCQR